MSDTRVSVFTVDAFADRAFRGNPAAVVPLRQAASRAWMQNVAAEMNLSETAFLEPMAGSAEEPRFGLRWFTPKNEVELCGHATLASAHVLWSEGLASPSAPVVFETLSGPLRCRRLEDGWIEMSFPPEPPLPVEQPHEALLAALRVEPRFIGRSRFDYMIEVPTEDEVRGVTPDLRLLRTVPVRGVCVTAPSADPRYDFVSRFFAPAAGIDEDPVTGSAHCTLGPFWGRRLGKSALTGRQISQRGGIVRCRLAEGRVFLSGRAVTVLRGELLA
ncbi:MAG TPA: PhzF family phenazine biosynthesis protein [Dehalococcoidia bacterium]|nr:PhzF family phenazine biosynthesis protein [Dehalococcoidia bacterium]